MAEIDKNVRKGIKLYKDYFEAEFKDLTDEEVGILIIALYQYDEFGQPTKEYSEKINNDRMLKSVFKRISINNDYAVAEWDRKRRYYAEKDKQKQIKEIMKSENCSYEEALDIYNFMQPDSQSEKTKAESKDKTESNAKSNLHNFNIFGILFSVELPDNISFSNEELENNFVEIKDMAETEKDDFIEIVNKTFEDAKNDNFKENITEYYYKIIQKKGSQEGIK